MKFFDGIFTGIIASGAIMTISCANSSTNQDVENEATKITFIEASDSVNLASNFSNISMIQLEQNDNCVIDNIVSIIDESSKLYVLTKSPNLYMFNKENGTFIKEIGSQGEGPGEYITAKDIFYNKNHKTINIFDPVKNSILEYDMDGNFISSTTIDAPLSFAASVTPSNDGYLLICNMLSQLKPISTHAYTIIEPNGDYTLIDSFEPVYVTEYPTWFADKPMWTSGDHISFTKFLNDTIFSLKKGDIVPEYILDMEKKLPPKELVAEMGPFGQDKLLELHFSGGYFSGFDKLFETSRHIFLVPKFNYFEGMYWIDKESGTGIHYPLNTPEVNAIIKQVAEGKLIYDISGAGNDEIISAYGSDYINAFQRVISENPDLNFFDKQLKTFISNADEDGNPILIFYEY